MNCAQQCTCALKKSFMEMHLERERLGLPYYSSSRTG